MLNRLLFQRIDNSPLLIFRIFFGILISLECFGALITGWVKKNLVEPQFTFPFIDFEWLQNLTGPGMYFYFAIMGTLGITIAIGYKYRFSIVAFTLLWTAVYLMQKTAYNNHYYLLILIALFMCFFPAHKNYAIDARNSGTEPKFHVWLCQMDYRITASRRLRVCLGGKIIWRLARFWYD
jgi:hypothetical protein